MKHSQRFVLGSAIGLLSVIVLGTGLVSAQNLGNQSRVRTCINQYIRNRTGRINVAGLRACLRNRNTSSASSRSRSSSSSLSSTSSSRSSSSSPSSHSSSSTSSQSSLSSSRSSSSSLSSVSSASSLSSSSRSSSSAVSSSQSSGIVQVNINNFAYSPANLVVKKGTTVRWTNNDDEDHTVTRDSVPGPFSGSLDQGESYSFTFNTVGTFPYHCFFHDDMHGSVQVTN